VAFVYDLPTAVPGFQASQKHGEEYLQEQLPCAEITAVESIPEGPGSLPTFASLADAGNDLIFGLSFGYGEQMLEVAEDFPDTRFEWALGYLQADNLSTFYGARYEAYYLAGIVAARQTTSGTLGFLGPFPIPSLVADLNAFTLGARSINPDATVQAVWTSAWHDPAKDRQATGTLIDEGAELIAQATGSPAVGAAAEGASVMWMGQSDPDVETFGPDTFLGAPYLNWGLHFLARANDVINDTWTSQSYFGTISDDFVDIALSDDNVSEDVVDEVDGKKQEIADGSLTVFAGPINAQDGSVIVREGDVDDFESMSTVLVEGVVGEIPQG
jgi:basic membrane lipoprotein Med (substrate-binding protein (PBP1-ABC) superfamily)